VEGVVSSVWVSGNEGEKVREKLERVKGKLEKMGGVKRMFK